MKHIPLRSCIVCRGSKEKSELLRVVRRPDGEVVIDKTGKEAGRGAYICRCGDCFATAVKKRALDRAFKQKLPQGIYDGLAAAIEEDGKQ